MAFACLMTGSSVGLAAVLTPLRHTLGEPNIALLLAALVGLAGIVGGRLAGGLAGVVAALSFNFFHAPPYLTLRVSDVHDVLTIVLIALLGAGAGQLGAARARRRDEQHEHLDALHGLEAVTALVAAGVEPGDVLAAVAGELGRLEGVASVTFEPVAGGDRALLRRDGHVETSALTHAGRGFALPPGGVRVPVGVDGAPLGQLAITGTSAAVTLEQRRVMVAMADELAVAWRSRSTDRIA
ncbi:MAG: DUF4118 domain-containing protein [Ilumatobacteraceae bacterium]